MELIGFQWDEWNSVKIAAKHGVEPLEAEEIFFNRPLKIASDRVHSTSEIRYAALGRTHEGRLLNVIFTVRGQLIRVISARPMNRKERKLHEEA